MFEWSTFIIFCISTTFTPGPNPILSMNYARLVGFRRTIPFILGVFSGFSIAMLFVSFFMQKIESLLPSVLTVLRILGVIYLLYLAWTTVVSRSDMDQDVEVDNLFRKGFFFQFVNPKIYLYGITAISGFILPYFTESKELVFFSFVLAFIAMLGNILWSLFGVFFQKIFAKHETVIRIVMGLLILYSAYKILF